MAKYTFEGLKQLAIDAKNTLTGYQKRLMRGFEQGLSRDQARGHARIDKGEKPITVIKAERAQVTSPTQPTEKKVAEPRLPRIDKRSEKLPNGTVVIRTNSSNNVARQLQKAVKGDKPGKLTRVSFDVYDPKTGKYIRLYQHKARGTKHGITADELMRRVEERMESGNYDDFDSALWDVLSEDSDDYSESEGSYGNVAMPESMTQVTMYIRYA